MEIRRITSHELSMALALVEETFFTFIRPDYPEGETVTFEEYLGQTRESLKEEMEREELKFWGAFSPERIMGIIALKGESHIRFFFVHGDFHKRGVGKALMKTLLQNAYGSVTVFASPYAVPIYKQMGFLPTDREQARGGVRFIPMKLTR